MRFDLSDLRLFLCVVDSGSITQGAQRANLALASASERLRSMEIDAGVPLLERQPRGVIATPAGEAVAHHARLLLQQQAMLKSELKEFASGARGTLLLHANTAALTHFLPPKLAVWLAERPHTHVDLRERTSVEIVQGINSGLIEAGIITDSASTPQLQTQPLVRDHLVLIVPTTHPLASQKNTQLAELLNEVFVGLAPGNALQDHVQHQARALGRELTLRIQMKTFDGLCTMVSHGIGLGILPQSIAASYRRRYKFNTLAIQDGWAQRQLCATYRDWARLSPVMRSLLVHLGVVPNPAA